MAKKRSQKVSAKRKKKSWWSFLFVLALATIIGVPVTYSLTNSSSKIASTGNSRIAELIPNYDTVKSINFSNGCYDDYGKTLGFRNHTITCTDGRKDSTDTTGCVYVVNVLIHAAKFCTANISDPTPTSSTTRRGTTTSSPTPTTSGSTRRTRSAAPDTTSGSGGGSTTANNCSGTVGGKTLICMSTACSSQGFASYSAGDSFCNSVGKANCCQY